MAKADKAIAGEAAPEGAVEPVATIEIAGKHIPVDAFFVSPVTRHIPIGEPGEVFLFIEGEPRQLPARVIVAAISQGITVAG